MIESCKQFLCMLLMMKVDANTRAELGVGGIDSDKMV